MHGEFVERTVEVPIEVFLVVKHIMIHTFIKNDILAILSQAKTGQQLLTILHTLLRLDPMDHLMQGIDDWVLDTNLAQVKQIDAKSIIDQAPEGNEKRLILTQSKVVDDLNVLVFKL
jgi:hypothetical protein